MSKNRNRAKLNKASENREYNMIMKNMDIDCYICVRRAGHYGASCHPTKKGFYRRLYRTWKHNRKTRWK